MATMKSGPFGLISGKLGNKIYYIVKGRQRSRTVGRVTKPRTEKQLSSQQAMKVAITFVKTVAPFVEMGFGPYTARRAMTPRNAAVGYTRKYAVKGEYPDVEVDYSKVLLSIGSLPGLEGVSASLSVEAGGRLVLHFNWTVEPPDRDWPRCDDQVMLLAYCPEDIHGDLVCYRLTGARRTAGQDSLELPVSWTGKAIEAYISVISDDRQSVANSQYVAVDL
jgi:hypothetical protein